MTFVTAKVKAARDTQKKIYILITDKLEILYTEAIENGLKNLVESKSQLNQMISIEAISENKLASDRKGMAFGVKNALGHEFGDVSGIMNSLMEGDSTTVVQVMIDKLGIHPAISSLIMGALTKNKEETLKGIQAMCSELKADSSLILPFTEFV